MKMLKIGKLKNALLFAILALSINIFAQEKFKVSAGIGLPELMNLEVGYRINQAQIGIACGFWPQTNESVISLAGNIYYHFGRLSRFSDVRPWYGRVGINYLRDQLGYTIEKYMYLNVRLGRDFNISEKVGIDIDAGAIFQLAFDTVNENNSFTIDFPVLPSFGIGFFYRL